MQQKTALVLSGGAMFGAYQAGAWQSLAPRFQPDIVVGASVGALNGWAIAGGCDPAELVRTWLDPSCSALTAVRISRTGFLDPKPLHARIREMWATYRPRTEVGVVAADLLRLRARLFRNGEIRWEHLAAACALLFCYPQIRIDGRLYTDGGLLTVLPVWAAAEMGATAVVAIHLLPQVPKAVRVAVRGLRLFASPLPVVPSQVKVVTIAPETPLGAARDSLFWNRAAAERWIELGRRDAERATALLSDNIPLCRPTESIA